MPRVLARIIYAENAVAGYYGNGPFYFEIKIKKYWDCGN